MEKREHSFLYHAYGILTIGLINKLPKWRPDEAYGNCLLLEKCQRHGILVEINITHQ